MFELYYRELLKFLARKVGDKELAADLTQESYARVYATQHPEDVTEPRALLYTTARNLVIDHHRRSTVRDQVEVLKAGDEPHDPDAGMGPESSEPDAVLAGRQRLAAIEQVVAKLPPRPREAFVLYKLDGLSRAEVAERMGISVRTVETHLEKAMTACLQRQQELDSAAPIVPAQFVKPYVKSNKNDTIDAAAIAEAITRPTMRFVQIKQCDQVDLQALHRSRDLLVSTRTRLINQMRAFCLEYGVAMRNGVGAFKVALPPVLSDESNDLTPGMRELLVDLAQELSTLEDRIAQFTRKINAQADASDSARRLATIPGVGQLTATALVAAVGDARQFKTARDLSAWLGLTPAQYSTGGKTHLTGISKRGNAYVRKLLIHGARSCSMHLDRTKDRLGLWIEALEGRLHHNKMVVALANKLARIAWVILTKPGALYERRVPQLVT